MQETKKQNFLKGAAILAAASVFVKIIGAVYKIPVMNILDDAGSGIFQVTYNVYTLILTIATAGIPAALSRLVSSAAARGNTMLVKRYFTVALPTFALIGIIAMLVMFLNADGFSGMMNNSMAASGIRVLAPAVFFVCIISVYRGYAQGFENMIPTAVSQIVEVICKAAFGVAAAMWLVRLNYGPDIVSAGAIMGVTVGLGLCIPLLVWYKRKLDRGISAGGAGEGYTGVAHDSAGTGVPADAGTGILEGAGVDPDYGADQDDSAAYELPGRWGVLWRIMKVSIPITLSASFMSIMVVIDNSIVLGRLQNALGFTEHAASALFGMYSRGLTIYNLPPALVVPVSVSIIPAIAAALARKRSSDGGKGADSGKNAAALARKRNRKAKGDSGADSGGEAGIIMQSSVKLVNLLAMPASAGMMVLASPIMTALYNDSRELTSTMLLILGAASCFGCLQYVTTAILQANGHERVALMTFPVGAAFKILLGYVLAGNPDFGIIASPIGTLVCFVVISALNIAFIMARVKDRPKFGHVFIKPLFCSAVMAGAAFAVYRLLFLLLNGMLGTGRYAVAAYLGLSMIAGIAVYGLLIIVTRTITMDDMKLVPKGEKLAKMLRIK